MLWTLRFRQPMGVKMVALETETDTLAEAEELGRWYVQQQGGPGFRYIGVERWVVARTADMRPPKAAPVDEASEDEEAPTPARPRTPRASAVPAGRIGA
jgi:hypothetical protein